MKRVRCPACQTVFRIKPEQLHTRGGMVRCGHCYTPFNALLHLQHDPLQQDESAADSAPTTPAFPEATPVAAAAQPEATKATKAPFTGRDTDAFFQFDETLHALQAPPASAAPAQFARKLDFEMPDSFLPRRGNTVPPSGTPASFPSLDESVAEHFAFRSTRPAPVSAPPHTEPPASNAAAPQPPLQAAATAAQEAETPLRPRRLTAQPPSGLTDQSTADDDDAAPTQPSDHFIAAALRQEAAPLPVTSASIRPDEDEIRPHRRRRREPAEHEPADDDATAPDASGQALAPTDGPAIRAASEIQEEADEAEADERPENPENPENPYYLRTTQQDEGRRGFLGLLVGILLGALVVQCTYLFRDDAVRLWPRLKPLYLEVCERLDCTVELPRTAGALHIQTSDLESNPRHPNHYVLNALIRNDAAHAVQYPHLELTLTDARDRPVVRRALAPAEWMPGAVEEDGIAAGAEIVLKLPFEAKGVAHAVGYRIYAFYP